ncbi:MAG: hypothetical protein KIT36_11380 [Alphaproteobacteria bacterium]|nr:hypothetical protein [Alphaproteobacteria bacterium]
MTTNSKNRDGRIREAIRRALLEEWDPIGVAGIAQAQDEYDAYVSTIFEMLVSRKTKQQVLDYLWWLETRYMGLAGNRQATERFADRLLQIPDVR